MLDFIQFSIGALSIALACGKTPLDVFLIFIGIAGIASSYS